MLPTGNRLQPCHIDICCWTLEGIECPPVVEDPPEAWRHIFALDIRFRFRYPPFSEIANNHWAFCRMERPQICNHLCCTFRSALHWQASKIRAKRTRNKVTDKENISDGLVNGTISSSELRSSGAV